MNQNSSLEVIICFETLPDAKWVCKTRSLYAIIWNNCEQYQKVEIIWVKVLWVILDLQLKNSFWWACLSMLLELKGPVDIIFMVLNLLCVVRLFPKILDAVGTLLLKKERD